MTDERKPVPLAVSPCGSTVQMGAFFITWGHKTILDCWLESLAIVRARATMRLMQILPDGEDR